MKRWIPVVVGLVVMVAAPLLAAVPAGAVDKGSLAFSPSSGSVNITLDMLTERGCPKGSSNTQATIFGPGFPDYGQNLTAVTPVAGGAGTPVQVTTQYTLRDTAALVYPAVVFQGNYRISVFCFKDSDGRVTADYSGVITFSSPVQWNVASSGAPVKPGPTTSLPPVTQKPSPSAPGSATPSGGASGSSTSSQSAGAPSASASDPAGSPSATDPSGSPSAIDPSGSPTSSPSSDESLAASPSANDGGSSWVTLLLVGLGGIAAGAAVVFFVLRRAA